MMDIDTIIKSIDTSKMEREGVDIYDICETEFEIFEWIEQPLGKENLTYCYFHRWICTNTEVGIRVWYYFDKPVCISWKPYRKSDEQYGWISKEDYENVKKYIFSLKQDDDDDENFNIVNDEIINNVVSNFEKIEFKICERKQTIPEENKYVKCFDKFGKELEEGDILDVQKDGEHKIYKKEDGQLYFKLYGKENRVSAYFSNDIIKVEKQKEF